MTTDAAIAFGVAAGVSLLLACGFLRAGAWRVVRTNHRGARIPVMLGVLFWVGLSIGDLAGTFPGLEHRPLRFGVLLLVAAGLLDDWRGSEARGIRGHLASLARGRVTTGIVKIVAGFVAAGFAVHTIGGGIGRQVAGVFVIAGATNIWNVLDVAPGRSLKLFLPAEAAVLAAVWGSAHVPLLAAALGAGAALVAFDVRERAMLGDAGSNPLGFLVGVGLYLALPLPALWLAFVLILVVQFLAETLTLTRLIRATPPLRWYDDVGRPRETKSSPDSAASR